MSLQFGNRTEKKISPEEKIIQICKSEDEKITEVVVKTVEEHKAYVRLVKMVMNLERDKDQERQKEKTGSEMDKEKGEDDIRGTQCVDKMWGLLIEQKIKEKMHSMYNTSAGHKEASATASVIAVMANNMHKLLLQMLQDHHITQEQYATARSNLESENPSSWLERAINKKLEEKTLSEMKMLGGVSQLEKKELLKENEEKGVDNIQGTLYVDKMWGLLTDHTVKEKIDALYQNSTGNRETIAIASVIFVMAKNLHELLFQMLQYHQITPEQYATARSNLGVVEE